MKLKATKQDDQIMEVSLVPRHTRAQIRRGVIATLIGGTFWGLNGTLSKYLMDHYGIDPLWLVCFRQMTTCWIFFAAAFITDRKQLRELPRHPKAFISFTLVGFFAVLLSQVSYLQAIQWTNSATATVLQSLGMALVLIYVCLRARRKPRKREVLGIIFALIGMYLIVTGGDPATLRLAPEGIFWGLLCAVAAACLSTIPERPMKRWGNFTVNAFGFLISGLALCLWYQPWNHMPEIDVIGAVLLSLCTVVGTFGAYALYLQGVSDAGPMRASILGTIEPVTATIATVLWLGTSFGFTDYLGFALIIVMVYLTA